MEVISRAVVVEIYVQQIVVLHVQQLNWQMNLNHKDYGMFQKQEKLILEMIEMIEMIVLIKIIMAIINKIKNIYLTLKYSKFLFLQMSV